MIDQIRVFAEPIRSLDASSMSGTFMGIGSRFDHPARFIVLNNTTNGIVNISLNGLDTHFIMVSDSYLVLDWCWNDTGVNSGLFLEKDHRVYASFASIFAPPVGAIYLSVFYGAS